MLPNAIYLQDGKNEQIGSDSKPIEEEINFELSPLEKETETLRDIKLLDDLLTPEQREQLGFEAKQNVLFNIIKAGYTTEPCIDEMQAGGVLDPKEVNQSLQ